MDRTTIENAALKLFHERGFDAVKVQDICAECGITKPTFYHYVPSKDDILLRYNEKALDTVEAHVAGTDPEGPVRASSWAPTWRSLTSASASGPTF